ncbi:MAG TPA: response regulator [Steroidobacteraceae bacterium]|nr:response regulator [Steroidobacteraceae bacterium]
MMDVIIVDDEPAARRCLRDFCGGEPDLRVVGEYGDPRAALEAIRAQPPHVLFLDIQMDSLNGLELARSLDPDTLPLIVFVTAYDAFALDAFEVRAVDYLLKPFDEERLRRTLAQVRHRRDVESAADRQAALASLLAQLERGTRALADASPRFVAERDGRMLMLEAAQVEVVEGDRNYVKLTVCRDVYHARSTLQQAEVSMRTEPMLRISRSCLVNTRHLREISRTPRGDFILVLSGGTTVTSSEGFREQVREYVGRLKIGAV